MGINKTNCAKILQEVHQYNVYVYSKLVSISHKYKVETVTMVTSKHYVKRI